eukprot:TRINITY_DN3662_c0_g1_i1.p1 TRINITY_DN3662_c0_g1~~TRINITY_DN3662_c0_g1_i1.p1  ORF type:complete len:341 (-),score=33.03 TRINITY_DN3662_c0_g1_i1:71-1093(-)
MSELECINGVIEELDGVPFCHCSSANWYGDDCGTHFGEISETFYTAWIIHQFLAFILIFLAGSYSLASLVYIYTGRLSSIKLSWRSCYTFVLIAIGCMLRCVLLIDIWGFHQIYNEDLTHILYFISYGLWGSAFMMEYGIWWQIVIDSGKLKLSTHWMKAVIFMVVMSVMFGAIVSIAIPLMWVLSDSLLIKGIIGYLVVGAIFMLLVASIPSGAFVLLRMKKYKVQNKNLRKQTKLIVLLGISELVFLLLAIAQTVIQMNYPDGTITGNYLTTYINWIYRALDGILLFLTIYALCDSPLTMYRKIRDGKYASTRTAGTIVSANNEELSSSTNSEQSSTV